MLGAGGEQQREAFAVEQHDRAQIDVELHVKALGLDVRQRCSDADARVVDEHVQTLMALAVGGHDLLDLALLGDVGGDAVHVEALSRQPRHGAFQLLGAPRGHRHREPLLAEHPGDRQSDAARCSRDDRCALCHVFPPGSGRRNQIIRAAGTASSRIAGSVWLAARLRAEHGPVAQLVRAADS